MDRQVVKIVLYAHYMEIRGVFIGMMPALKGKEWYKTQGYKEIGLVHGTTEKSYKKSSDLLNRIRHQEGATPTRTLRDNSVAEGQSIQKKIHELSQEILAEHQFSELGMPSKEAEQYSEQSLQKWSEEEQTVENVIAQAALVKNQDYVDRLVEYFKRNRPYIPCYSVRKILNLPNSSQAGEKLNDLLVSHRQKRNGMSWSISGSVALATLSSLIRNGEASQWFQHGSLDFHFAPAA